MALKHCIHFQNHLLLKVLRRLQLWIDNYSFEKQCLFDPIFLEVEIFLELFVWNILLLTFFNETSDFSLYVWVDDDNIWQSEKRSQHAFFYIAAFVPRKSVDVLLVKCSVGEFSRWWVVSLIMCPLSICPLTICRLKDCLLIRWPRLIVGVIQIALMSQNLRFSPIVHWQCS